MTDHTELKRLAEAFPADLDWDSNTEPFFNGPSGESLGGGATGFYCVYGKPFRLEGEDYDYDGPTYVEACNADFAKFMVAAREGVLGLISEIDRLREERDSQQRVCIRAMEESCKVRTENREMLEFKDHMIQLRETHGFDSWSAVLVEVDRLRAENEALRTTGFGAAFYQVADRLGVTGARPVSPMQVFTSEVLPALDEAIKDAERYRWTSIEGNWVARMFGKWRAHIGEYGDAQPTDWYPSREEAIDAAMSKDRI